MPDKKKIDSIALTAALQGISKRAKEKDPQAVALQAFIDSLLEQIEQARPADPTISGWHPATAGDVLICLN